MYVVRNPSVPDWDPDGNLTFKLPYLTVTRLLIGFIDTALSI